MIAASIALGWAVALAILALACLLRVPRAAPSGKSAVDRVLITRPCAGAEPWLEENLASLLDAPRSFEARCVIAYARASDGAAPAAEAAARRLTRANVAASIVVTAVSAANAKAGQLARITEGFDGEVIVVADSDVDLAGVDLDALLAPLGDPRVALVWAPPVEREASGFGDRASRGVLTASLHAFPLLARLDPHGAVGKLCAIRASALASIGGFGALENHLGEDVELARRLLAAGSRIVAAPFVARSRPAPRTFRQVRARYARWLSVVRAQRPALVLSYPTLFFATPLVMMLALAGAPGAPLLAALAIGVALAARASVAVMAARASGRGLDGLALDAALADLVLFLATVDAVLKRAIVWRGRALTFDDRGRLVPAAAEPGHDG